MGRGEYKLQKEEISLSLSYPTHCALIFFHSFFSLFHAVPNPAVMITSTPVSPICPVESISTVTLTCAVDLSPLVDVPVTVTAQIFTPMGVTVIPITNSVMENATRYTSIATVSPFGRNQSGEYTCMANVRLVTANSFITGGTGVTGMDKITVSTGKHAISHTVLIFLRHVPYLQK